MMMQRRRFVGAALLFSTSLVLARQAAARPRLFAPSGVALDGADSVAYHTLGQMVKGRGTNQLRWQGAIWTFSCSNNLATFEANPVRYAPQFGGYCAVCLADGALAGPDAACFSVTDERLYLTCSHGQLAELEKYKSTIIPAATAAFERL